MTDPNFAAVQLWQSSVYADFKSSLVAQGTLTTAKLTIQDAEI